jgi:hypothetical protein
VQEKIAAGLVYFWAKGPRTSVGTGHLSSILVCLGYERLRYFSFPCNDTTPLDGHKRPV